MILCGQKRSCSAHTHTRVGAKKGQRKNWLGEFQLFESCTLLESESETHSTTGALLNDEAVPKMKYQNNAFRRRFPTVNVYVVLDAKQRDWEKMVELSGGAQQRSSYGKSRQRAQAKYARALLMVSCARWRLFKQHEQCWCDEDSSEAEKSPPKLWGDADDLRGKPCMFSWISPEKYLCLDACLTRSSRCFFVM